MPQHLGFHDFDRPQPIEDNFAHVTQKQINFIEILKNDLGMTLASRNVSITNIIGTRWKNDVWALSRSEASQIIEKFKQYKIDQQQKISERSPQRPWDD